MPLLIGIQEQSYSDDWKKSRWDFCHCCQKLLPHSKLHLLKVSRLHNETCSARRIGMNSHTEYCCMDYTGTVDICPCLGITFRDARHLINMLESAHRGTMEFPLKRGYENRFHTLTTMEG